MAHFAKVVDSIVENVIVVPNEHEANGQEWLNSIGLDGTWVQTSYNHRIRKHFAGIGFSYDEERDAFIPPKPSEDAVLDEATCTWILPTETPAE
jgi:hypothetical protein